MTEQKSYAVKPRCTRCDKILTEKDITRFVITVRHYEETSPVITDRLCNDCFVQFVKFMINDKGGE